MNVEQKVETWTGAAIVDVLVTDDEHAVTHTYLSTACLHRLHPRCRLRCKFCDDPCHCDCHSTDKADPR